MKSNSKTWGNWAIRKIRNGRVKFHGYWYYADETYDNSLDDTWMAFYSYTIRDEQGRVYFYPYICPWGTLEYYNADLEDKSELFSNSPLWDKDGSERWHLWYPKRTDIVTMINSVDDVQLKRHLTMQAKQVLLPGMDYHEQYRIIDLHFSESYSDYRRVNTHPQEYTDLPIIEGLQS
jgi:hypothetical protein